jgi:hypothetical protein
MLRAVLLFRSLGAVVRGLLAVLISPAFSFFFFFVRFAVYVSVSIVVACFGGLLSLDLSGGGVVVVAARAVLWWW